MTTAKELSDSLDKFGETALRVKAERDKLLNLLERVWIAYGRYGDIPASLLEEIEKEVQS